MAIKRKIGEDLGDEDEDEDPITGVPQPCPDPPDPPPLSTSITQSSFTKDFILPSPALNLDKSAAPFDASDLAHPSSPSTGTAFFSFGSSPSVARQPSSATKKSLIQSPDLDLDNSIAPAIASDSVPANSIPACATKISFRNSASVALPSSVSWAKKVKAPIQRVTYPILSDSGIPGVRIPTAIFKEGAARHREFVALTFLDKTPSMGKIHAFLSYLWGESQKIEIFTNSSGTIVARVQSEVMRQKILEVQLWHIDGDAFIAQEWSHKFFYSKPNLEAISIWVRFNNVPCDLITEAGLFSIGGALGDPVAAKNLHGFSSGEVQVKVNLSQPLPDQVEVEIDEGDIITLEASYLRLPPICLKCRIIGHRESACTMLNHSSSVKVQETVACSVLLNPEPQAEVFVTAPLMADAENVDPIPQVISDIVSPKTAFVSETLQTPSISAKEITITEENIPGVAEAAFEQKSYAKVVATPNRISSSPPVQIECVDTIITNPTSANAIVTRAFSSPMSDKPPPTDAISSHSLVKHVVTFGNLLDKNGVFIGDDWHVSTQKSRGGRRLKPSQKKQEMQWSQSRGGQHRGGHRSKN